MIKTKEHIVKKTIFIIVSNLSKIYKGYYLSLFMSDISDFIKATKQIGQIPKDQFGHSWQLLSRDDVKINRYPLMQQNPILLANIKNNQLIRLYQNDFLILTSFYNMGIRYSPMFDIFEFLYYGWEGELGITRTKDGKERIIQAMSSTGYRPKEDIEGYGFDEVRREQDEALAMEQKKKRFGLF